MNAVLKSSADHAIADPALADWGRKEIQIAESEMPALMAIRAEYAKSQSLKQKRMVLRRVKDRTRDKFNVAVAEVEENDVWQRAVIGLAVVGNERRFVESSLDEVVRFVRSQAEVVNAEREVQTFSDALAVNDLGIKY